MKLHKILILSGLTISLHGSLPLLAAGKKTADKKVVKASSPLSLTVEKAAAISHLVGACADSWASENQNITKSTKNLITGLAAAARLASNITTQMINLNEDSSRISLAHAPWIIFDASQLINILLNKETEELQLASQFDNDLTAEETDQAISAETYSSLQKISRQFRQTDSR